MRTEREYAVTFIIATIAALVIIGGYASFSGLASYSEPLSIEMAEKTFARGDVFDVNVVLSPVTFMADESIVVYIDGQAVGVVAIKKYLDDNRIDYGRELKSLGQNNAEIINLKAPLKVNLADYVLLEYLGTGGHSLRVEFSRGDAAAQEVFGIV
jgi:hypothetical protein